MVVILVRVRRRWLLGLDQNSSWRVDMRRGAKAPRRLFNAGIKVDYTIVVPANNPEKRTGMGAVVALMNAPLGNITKTVRSRLVAAIGTNAGLSVTAVMQPELGVVPHDMTTTTVYNTTSMRKIATARARPWASLNLVVAFLLFSVWYSFYLCSLSAS